MTPPRSFKLNQYNWLGQKFLALHRYDDILRLRESLTHRRANESDVYIGDKREPETSRPLSDHLSYITGLALIKTSNNLEELIYTLQRLSFQKNSQYFLLLCQCLLYLGNHDSVVAICKQVLNKEIFALAPPSPPNGSSSTQTTDKQHQDQQDLALSDQQDKQASELETKSEHSDEHSPPPPSPPPPVERDQPWRLDQICEESIEFRKSFESVSQNCLINNPKLWFIFALSLEYQLQFKDADLAHRVASKLASGQARQIIVRKRVSVDHVGSVKDDAYDQTADGQPSSVGISNFYLPHTNYSEFCVRHRADYRTAMQILGQVSQVAPPINYTLNPHLALTLCSQSNSNSGHFTKALEMITALDNHTNSLRNPSFTYNQLALKSKQKWLQHTGCHQSNETTNCYDYLQRVCDENQSDLEYNLIKSHILVNSIVQGSMHNPMLYKWSEAESPSANEVRQIFAQIDKLIETLRNCDTSCWLSHSLWNNLGVCYLIKRRYIASLSCLLKAHQLNPLDWRINYNLSLVYLHVGTSLRALCCSLASRSFHRNIKLACNVAESDVIHVSRDQMISTMIALSYSELGLIYEARRFYAELVAQCNGKVPVLTLINYLLLLQQDDNLAGTQNQVDTRDQNMKSSSRLLDLLEQAWLQRSPNNVQFSPILLDAALRIGQALQESGANTKKNYAWTKYKY